MIWEGNAFRTRNKKRGDTTSKHFAKTKKISGAEVRLCRLLILTLKVLAQVLFPIQNNITKSNLFALFSYYKITSNYFNSHNQI